MKKLFTGILALAVLATAAPAVAQDTPDPMQTNLDKKLSSPFIEKGGWYTDFDKAKKAAAEAGKPIFAYFTRSYAACPPCLQMEGSVLVSEEFIKFSKGKILFVSIMSRVKDRPNDNLLGKYGFRGFPSFAILNAEGEKVGQPVGRTVEAFAKAFADVARIAELKKKAAAGDEAAKAELAKMEKAEELKKLLKSINKTNRTEVVQKLYTAYVEGTRLTGPDADWMYYVIVLQGAIEAKDLKTFDTLAGELDKQSKTDMRVKMIIQQMNLPELRKKIESGE